MNKIRLKFCVAIVCSFVMMFSLCVNGYGNEINRNDMEQENITVVEEVETLRTENTKHFLMSDGTYKAVMYDTPVHRKNSEGEWQNIDNELQECSVSKNLDYTTKDKRVSFSKNPILSDNKICEIMDNEYSIKISYLSDMKKDAIKSKVDNSTIIYENLISDASLEYILSGNDVKENIIVEKAKEAYVYTFMYEVKNLSMYLNNDGTISLVDKETLCEKYTIPVPFMYDAEDNLSYNVHYELDMVKDGIYELKVIADEKWINETNRKFPIVIDPSISVSANYADTYISSSSPNTNYGSSSDLWVSSSNITYMKSVSLPSIPTNAKVTDARLHLYYYYHITTGSLVASIHQVRENWGENTLTWYTASDYNAYGLDPESVAEVTFNAAQSISQSSPGIAMVNVTETVSNWYAGQPNYGIGIVYERGVNQSVIIKSRESGAKPVYVITYTTPTLPVAVGTYCINNVEYERYMQIDDNSSTSTNGAKMELWEFDGAADQKWNIVYLHNGFYKIVSTASGKALTSGGVNYQVTQTNYVGNESQMWQITSAGNGQYKISPKSDVSYYLSAGDGTITSDGRNVKVRAARSDNKDEWNMLCLTGSECIVMGINDEGHDHHTVYGNVMPNLVSMGYKDFNYIVSDSVQKTELKNKMSNSKVYVSRSHGDYDSLGTFILLNSAATIPFHSSDIYNFSTNTALIDLSSNDLMLFVGCYTGKDASRSLPHAAVAAGAKKAIGFKETISCNKANDWTEYFFDYYSQGYSVESSAQYATSDCDNLGGISSYRIVG